jgi:hypothetical protein
VDQLRSVGGLDTAQLRVDPAVPMDPLYRAAHASHGVPHDVVIDAVFGGNAHWSLFAGIDAKVKTVLPSSVGVVYTNASDNQTMGTKEEWNAIATRIIHSLVVTGVVAIGFKAVEGAPTFMPVVVPPAEYRLVLYDADEDGDAGDDEAVPADTGVLPPSAFAQPWDLPKFTRVQFVDEQRPGQQSTYHRCPDPLRDYYVPSSLRAVLRDPWVVAFDPTNCNVLRAAVRNGLVCSSVARCVALADRVARLEATQDDLNRRLRGRVVAFVTKPKSDPPVTDMVTSVLNDAAQQAPELAAEAARIRREEEAAIIPPDMAEDRLLSRVKTTMDDLIPVPDVPVTDAEITTMPVIMGGLPEGGNLTLVPPLRNPGGMDEQRTHLLMAICAVMGVHPGTTFGLRADAGAAGGTTSRAVATEVVARYDEAIRRASDLRAHVQCILGVVAQRLFPKTETEARIEIRMPFNRTSESLELAMLVANEDTLQHLVMHSAALSENQIDMSLVRTMRAHFLESNPFPSLPANMATTI